MLQLVMASDWLVCRARAQLQQAVGRYHLRSLHTGSFFGRLCRFFGVWNDRRKQPYGVYVVSWGCSIDTSAKR
jgi:hypothetical protein